MAQVGPRQGHTTLSPTRDDDEGVGAAAEEIFASPPPCSKRSFLVASLFEMEVSRAFTYRSWLLGLLGRGAWDSGSGSYSLPV